MKIKGISIIQLLVTAIIVIKMRFFYIGIDTNLNMIPVLMIASYLLCYVLCKQSMYIISIRMIFIRRYTRIVLLSTAILFVFTIIAFPDQSISSTVIGALPYLSIILVYPFICIMLTYGDDHLLKLFNSIAVLWYGILIVQSVVYLFSRRILLTTPWLSTRFNGFMRINLYDYGSVMILYNFCKLYSFSSSRIKKIVHFIFFIMGLFSLIFVGQTRGFYVSILGCLLIIILYSGRNQHNRFVRNMFLISIGVLIVLSSGMIPSVFSSFDLVGEHGMSTSYRMYGYNYYWNYFLNHPIFGMGFAFGGNYPSIVRGPMGWAASTDVGFVGQLGKIGIFIVPIYVGMCSRLLYIIVKMRNIISRNEWVLYLSMFFYVILTSFSLIVLDYDRCLFYSSIIALFEYKYYSCNLKKEEDCGY